MRYVASRLPGAALAFNQFRGAAAKIGLECAARCHEACCGKENGNRDGNQNDATLAQAGLGRAADIVGRRVQEQKKIPMLSDRALADCAAVRSKE